jgi:predicted metal-binding membrane protein
MMIHAVSDRRFFLPLLAALIALAWLMLGLWGISPYSHLCYPVRGSGLLLLVFMGSWTLMIVAMMLPTSLPLVMLFDTVVRQRADRPRLIAALIIGYITIWMLFGALVYLGDSIIHAAADHVAWLEANAWAISAATLALAGLYQFTPLKYICLDKCRSPLSFIAEHWRGRNAIQETLRLGIYHGLFCLGCCWSLMLLMFTVGVGNFGWMLLLSSAMATEKNMPWGRRISTPLGLLLILGGLAVTLRALPGLG